MRITPVDKFQNLPCSYVGTACAYEDLFHIPFPGNLPDGLRKDGYLPLKKMDTYIRQYLPVKKKIYYSKKQRIPLRKFLQYNKSPAGVCVYGHFIYVNNENYTSFFDNEEDPVVCIWYLDKKE